MPQPRQHPDAAAKQRAYRARQAQGRRDELHAKGLPPAAPIATLPSRARWHALHAQAHLALQTVHDEMEAYADARSDAWQESERAAALAEHLDALSQVLDDLEALPPF
jgi:hypothetical protein